MMLQLPRVLLLVALTAAPTVAVSDSTIQLIASIQQHKDGFFSAKQEIREDGVFATEDIAKGEALITVPAQYAIEAEREGSSNDLHCNLVRALIAEVEKGEASDHAAYVQHLLDTTLTTAVPSAWSEAGRYLFEEITDGLTPGYSVGWLTDDWETTCGGGNSTVERTMALAVVAHSEDEAMIPFLDFYEHANGVDHNVDHRVKPDSESRSFYATRKIKAGEQLHASQNLCKACNHRTTRFGTPEIFRDQGILEDYPQRWGFHIQDLRVDLDEDEEDGTIAVTFYDMQLDEPMAELEDVDIVYLRHHVQRLQRIGNIEWNTQEDGHIPEHEWKSAMQYHAAIMNAMKLALITHFDGDEDLACLDGKVIDDKCVVQDTYDDLDDDKDDVDYITNVCDIDEILEFREFHILAGHETHYQDMRFMVRGRDKNICMDLDMTVQICSDYRPHYHEYIVDYPARYLDEVKRVLFIGGGDSMILHEVLKYPELELVVGLEIDQQVTRQVFKRMHTQPHFDDDRVEWWYGDATKSLVLLPEDYAASFDMVLVDLSETVTSLTVTDELDVLEALSLYLKPDGVMVKNEFYHNKMAEIFDYTAEIHVDDVPTICKQAMVYGSNKRDFFHHIAKDHDVEYKLIDPIVEDLDRLRLIHDFRKNNATEQGKCKTRPQPELVEQTKAAGQHMILNVEKVTMDLSSTSAVKDAVTKAVEEVGLTSVEPVAKSTTEKAFIITLKEGYVMARLWKDSDYIAFDAHLWGAFSKYEALRDALIALSGSPKGSYSSYRVVVGGMFGYPEWKKDQSTMGPQMNAMSRNCDVGTDVAQEAAKEIKPIDKETIDKALSHTIDKMLWMEGGVALVVCGAKDALCTSREVMEQKEGVKKVVAVYSCDGIDTTGSVEVRSASMYVCEYDITKQLRNDVGESLISTMIVDESAEIETAKVVFSIMSSTRNRKTLLQDHSYMVVSFMRDTSEIWRRGLLEKMRRDEAMDPSSRAQVRLSSDSSGSSVEMGVLSIGDYQYSKHLGELVLSMKEATGLDAKVEKVQGGKWAWFDNFSPREYLPEAYDPTPAMKQYEEQKPFGRQSIFQLEQTEDGEPIVPLYLAEAIALSLFVVGARDKLTPQMDEDMEGCVITSLYDAGSVVLVWDGRKHLDINLFSYDQDEEVAVEFISVFQKIQGSVALTLRDDQPRGIGRVVNFQSDIDHVDVLIEIEHEDDNDDGDDDEGEEGIESAQADDDEDEEDDDDDDEDDE